MTNSFKKIGEKADKVRNINLNSILLYCECTKDRLDKKKWHTTKGIISVNGPKFMNWTLKTGGGGAIDLAIHLNNIEFTEAVIWLSDNFTPSLARQTCSKQTSLLKQPLKLPQKDDKKLQLVTHYLCDKRCIPQTLINNLIQSGKLYADVRGNAVFIMLGKEKKVIGAELRGVHNTRWRGMAPGSLKKLGCFYIVGASNRKMVLCESAIDAASCFVLNPEYTAISTSGATPDPAWLQNFINKGCKVYCGYDADKTGDMIANKMIKIYPDVNRLRPPLHDWNEVLQNHRP
jgi:hypothetical protein